MDDQLKQSTLDSHELPVPGRIQASPTKPLTIQRDLASTYSLGVAVPRLEIEEDPLEACKYTARGNLMAVIPGDTAVLGLGDIDVLVDKPVMEGKGVLFEKLAGIDVFDTEVDEFDLDKSIEVVAVLESAFGGVNLEDVKASECFYIKQELRERVNIPISHGDQYGTAIISTAAILNGLRAVEKNISDVWMVASGAGTAAVACTNPLATLGLQKHNIVVCGSEGIIYQGRESNMAKTKTTYVMVDNGKRTPDDVAEGTDILLDCFGSKVLTREMVGKMARAPAILALANPEPEILPPLAKEVRPDAIIYTGRSDYPNQVNNALCLPFAFRGVLGAGATAINGEMKLAAVHAIAGLIHAEQSGVVASAYGSQDLSFDSEYIIPKPFDPRLIVKIAPAIAKTTMESGVTTRPIADFGVHIDKLTELVYKINLFMKPIFSQARKAPKHVVLPEEKETRVLHATQELVTLGLAKPILIGRPDVIEMRIRELGLQIKADIDSEVVNSKSDPRFREYRTEYFQIMKRRDVTQEQVQRALTSNPTVIDAIMVQRGETDAMICGTVGDYREYLSVAKNISGYRGGVHTVGAMNALLLPNGNTFIADTYVSDEPDVEELAEITLMTVEIIRRFGIEPRVALLSHSSFGSSDCPSSGKMHQALELIRERTPELMIDGEMHDDAVLVEAVRNNRMLDNSLKGSANILMMPGMEAAHISYNLLRVSSSEGVTVGPVLTGVAKPVHVLAPVASVRRIANTVVLAMIKAQTQPL